MVYSFTFMKNIPVLKFVSLDTGKTNLVRQIYLSIIKEVTMLVKKKKNKCIESNFV